MIDKSFSYKERRKLMCEIMKEKRKARRKGKNATTKCACTQRNQSNIQELLMLEGIKIRTSQNGGGNDCY